MPTSTEPTVDHLADLVTCQDGSVVSRMLLKKASGNITLFAFGAGEGLSEHTAPFDAFVYVVEGEATITLDGTPHTLAAGDMLILPADVPHAVHAATDLKMLLVMLRA